MTRQKSFKHRVRARMAKTGESYTAARRHLVAPANGSTREPEPTPTGIQANRPPESSVRERTGRGWEEWFALLDAWGGTTRTHTEIARWLVEEHGVEGWWAQSITVGYEQERGMRAPGQKADGTFAAGASRTVDVPVERLFEAFADPDLRERWLPDTEVPVRTATAPKSFRFDWPAGSGRVAVAFTPKGETKSHASLSHERLPDSAEAARMKAFWKDRLSALKRLMESGATS